MVILVSYIANYSCHPYVDLNGSHYDILHSPPSALEFLRLVHISRPVVIRGIIAFLC